MDIDRVKRSSESIELNRIASSRSIESVDATRPMRSTTRARASSIVVDDARARDR